MRLYITLQLRLSPNVYFRRNNIVNLWQQPRVGAALVTSCCNNKERTNLTRTNNRRFGWLKFTYKHPAFYLSLQRPYAHQFSYYSTKSGNKDDLEEERLSLFQRFKQMYRDYWYVLVPVHVATSVVWFGSFYYIAKSGVDVAALLTSMGFGEKITSPLKDSSAGHLAVAYAMYKIATPARYTVTLGGTTISINYLKQWGYIKPIPPKEKLKEMYAEKKESMVESYREKKESMVESYREKKESVRSGLQEARQNITEGLRQSLSSKGETPSDNLPESKSKSDCGSKT